MNSFIEDYLNSQGGEEGLIQRVMDNYGMKAAYLEDTGKHIEKVTMLEEAKKHGITLCHENEKKIFSWVHEGQTIQEIADKGGYF